MHGLSQIIRMNDRAAQAKVEDNFSRECSWTGSVAGGIVLHSARFRNTVFLKPGAQCNDFVFKARKAGSLEDMNHLIEGYFV